MCLSELFCTVSASTAIENWPAEYPKQRSQHALRPRISPNTCHRIKPLVDLIIFTTGFMLHFRTLEKAYKITQLKKT